MTDKKTITAGIQLIRHNEMKSVIVMTDFIVTEVIIPVRIFFI